MVDEKNYKLSEPDYEDDDEDDGTPASQEAFLIPKEQCASMEDAIKESVKTFQEYFIGYSYKDYVFGEVHEVTSNDNKPYWEVVATRKDLVHIN